MIEKLIFEIGGFFSEYKQIKIWAENGKIYKSFNSHLCTQDDERVKEMSSEEIKKFESKLADLKINGWKKEYVDPDVLDGTQWGLEYKEQGKRCRHIYGSNDYPERWDEFIKSIEIIEE